MQCFQAPIQWWQTILFSRKFIIKIINLLYIFFREPRHHRLWCSVNLSSHGSMLFLIKLEPHSNPIYDGLLSASSRCVFCDRPMVIEWQCVNDKTRICCLNFTLHSPYICDTWHCVKNRLVSWRCNIAWINVQIDVGWGVLPKDPHIITGYRSIQFLRAWEIESHVTVALEQPRNWRR